MATNTHETTEELWEAVFSIQCAPRLYTGNLVPRKTDQSEYEVVRQLPPGGGVAMKAEESPLLAAVA